LAAISLGLSPEARAVFAEDAIPAAESEIDEPASFLATVIAAPVAGGGLSAVAVVVVIGAVGDSTFGVSIAEAVSEAVFTSAASACATEATVAS
jgi:hypothetical protein